MSARATRRPAPAVERARKTAGRPVTADDRTPACPRAATSEHATLRRRQILDAAEDCFRRHGFHNTSMAEIAKSFGMSAGHIYNYFDSKEAIIAAIVERDLEDFMLRATALQAADDIRAAMLARVEASVADQLSTTRAARQFEVLAEAGRQYAAYFKGAGAFAFAIDLPAGDYRVHWFDVVTGREDSSPAMLTHPGGTAGFVIPNGLNECALKVVREMK